MFVVVATLGLTAIPSNARTLSSYSQKPIFSVVGDSISSHDFYEDYTYYRTGTFFEFDKNNMWWSVYSNNNGLQMGWSASVSSAQVSLEEGNYFSFFYPSRINHLGNNGFPDYIAVFGGTNDANAGNSASLFYSSYNSLVNKLHSMFDGIKLILMAPNYFPSSYSAQNSLINVYDNYIENIAGNNNDYFVDLRGVYNNTTDCVQNGSDVIHPNESGMQKIADAITTALANARGTTGIESIRADLDYDHYIIKINAYDENYDNLNFKFRLTNCSTDEVIYNTDWQKDNCFYLDDVDTTATYEAYAEIDNNSDGVAEGTLSRDITGLVLKRIGGTIYNGTDYSAVYDFNYYVENNQDLYNVFRNNPYGAIEHFVNCGMNEARQAKADFDVTSYRNRYSDLRQAFGWNNLKAYYDHYRACGKREGRIATGCPKLIDGIHTFFGADFSPVYDYNYYIDHNPDVYKAFNGDETQVLIHFLSAGMKEGRRACAGFDVYSYRNQWSDLRQAFGWSDLSKYYLHYVNAGVKEKRSATGCSTLQNPIHSFFGADLSPIYDYQCYIENNPDVYRAFNGDDGATFGHFLTCGVNEGRKATEGFDVYSYRNQHADLRQAFGWNDLAKYYFHYVNAGKNEGRVATGCSTLQNPIHVFWGTDFSPAYDYEYYKNHNADLRIAFGDNDMDYFAHFLTNGMKEGRQASANFNVWTYMSNYADLRNAFGWELSGYYLHYINCGKKEGRIAV